MKSFEDAGNKFLNYHTAKKLVFEDTSSYFNEFDDEMVDFEDYDEGSDSNNTDDIDAEISIEENPETEGPDGYDISQFGMHGGPDVPENQYNEADVSRLNYLISSESDAINDYFEATEKTSDKNLSKLYGDIGHEERFHLEQLMYAKSLLTGEKYVPKDPDVKKEYDELIGGGMDEETAAYTAIDKVSISGPIADDDMSEELEADVNMTEAFLLQNQILNDIILDHTDFYKNMIEPQYAMYAEAVIMEDVMNTSTLPKQLKKGTSPIKFIFQQFINLFNLLLRLGRKVRDYLARNRTRRDRISNWIDRHGISALFKNGYSFYTYNDKTNKFDFAAMLKYIDLMFRLTGLIAKNCGLSLSAENPVNLAKYGLTPFSLSDAVTGSNFVNGIILTKTKCLVNEKNEDYIKAYLFGYTKNKHNLKIVTTDDTGAETTRDEAWSMNVYNSLNIVLADATVTSKLCKELTESLEDMVGDPDSVYTKNLALYNRSVSQLSIVMKGLTKIANAVNSDLSTMLSIDNYIIQQTNAHDEADKKHEKYEGDTVTLDNYKQRQMSPDQNNNNNKQSHFKPIRSN